MTATQHTPGPWAAVLCSNCISIGLEADAGSGGVSIAFTERTDDQAMPDMKLIAAAPELLIALRDLLEVLKPDRGLLPLAYERAEAAIAKAVQS